LGACSEATDIEIEVVAGALATATVVVGPIKRKATRHPPRARVTDVTPLVWFPFSLFTARLTVIERFREASVTPQRLSIVMSE
jgi:hypothetical protein